MFCYKCMKDKGNAVMCPHCGECDPAENAPHQLRLGTVLAGKYTVGCAIGEGGFGITYIGRDNTLDIRVAVKEYYPSGFAARCAPSPEVVVSAEKHREVFDKGRERFLLEARNVAKFGSDTKVVDVRDYFEENGTAYMIMEYLEGMNLSEYLKGYGPMDAARAFTLMLPVMRSLERINAEGIIHRDISPDNIMFLSDGSLELVDFGSARDFSTDSEMSVLLKPGYAPEEQYRKSGRQGPWTDVYGLCATLYKMITGKVPTDALDRMHEDDLQPPSALGVKISPPLEKVLMYGLAVYSENRCPDMTRLIALTEKALAGSPVRVNAAMPEDMTRRRATDSGYKDAVEGDTRYGDSFTGGSGEPDGIPSGKGDKPPKKNTGIMIIIIIIVAAMILGGAAMALILGAGGSGGSDPTGTVTETAAESAARDDTQPEKVRITDVVDMKLDTAMSALRLQGLDARVAYVQSDKRRDYVVKMEPEAGTEVAKGSTVTLYIPDEKVTEAPTEAPTSAPTESDTYICMGVGGALFHKGASRASECYDATVPAGGEVTYLGATEGEMMKVKMNGAEGWVLARLFAKAGSGAQVVNDREYNEQLTCKSDTVLYSDTQFKSGTDIAKGETAVQVGYCPGVLWDNSDDYYEIYYKGKVYYLPFNSLHDGFEYSTTW